MIENVPPDFAVEAARLLSASDPLAAARLSASGIACYPDYAGGYVLLAKAYAALGRSDDAMTMVLDARERFPYITITLPDAMEPLAEITESKAVVISEEVGTAQPSGVETNEDATDTPVVPAQVLRMIETMPIANDARIIRSSSVRLIPGLEFTSLRVEGLRSRGRRGVGSLPDPPAFRTFHQVRRPQRPVEPPTPRKPVSLEELAQRLAEAKIPRPTEIAPSAQRSEPSMPAQPQPIKVTETIAKIYMQQQSYDLAIEAFKHLMAQRPDRKDHFEALINECERKRG